MSASDIEIINFDNSSLLLINSGTEYFNLLRFFETKASLSEVECNPLPVINSISLFIFLAHELIISLPF